MKSMKKILEGLFYWYFGIKEDDVQKVARKLMSADKLIAYERFAGYTLVKLNMAMVKKADLAIVPEKGGKVFKLPVDDLLVIVHGRHDEKISDLDVPQTVLAFKVQNGNEIQHHCYFIGSKSDKKLSPLDEDDRIFGTLLGFKKGKAIRGVTTHPYASQRVAGENVFYLPTAL